jgi:hypothetical protein
MTSVSVYLHARVCSCERRASSYYVLRTASRQHAGNSAGPAELRQKILVYECKDCAFSSVRAGPCATSSVYLNSSFFGIFSAHYVDHTS